MNFNSSTVVLLAVSCGLSSVKSFAPVSRPVSWGRVMETTWSSEIAFRSCVESATLSNTNKRHQTNLSSGFLGQDDFGSDSSNDFFDDSEDFAYDSTKEYRQTMTPAERKENLAVIRQIFKYDLKDLQNRRDYAGWVQARKDLKKRRAGDPWFELNDKLKEAVQLDMPDSILEKLKSQIKAVGGPPEGVNMKREFAMADEIYELDMSLGRAEAIAEFEQRKRNNAKWQKMIAEREANERRAAEEEKNTNPYLKQEEEARKRREKTMRIIYGKVEEERKIKEEKAKEIQEKYGIDKDALNNAAGISPLDRAIEAAKKSLEESKKAKGLGEFAKSVEGNVSSASSETKSDSASNKSDKGGRPRMPGDMDITRGEMQNGDTGINDSSDVTSNNVQVKVTTSYNAAQSDPPMRKHCFAYTIKITNLSSSDTIQLVSRKFEIQTVGARQKDVVAGQGVTGRQPILKPGETFEYTSTAPLSVRPLGTTIVAARMKGEYEFNIVEVDPLGGTDSDGNPKVKILTDSPKTAELGMFHFVFPEDQRVKPVQRAEDEDDEDDDDDSTPSAPAASSSPAGSPAAVGVPSLPGDDDMKTGAIKIEVNDQSETVTEGVEVKVTSQYREERSDAKMDKHCFAYNIRITNLNKDYAIQLTGRKFEIQTIGSAHKDVVAGPGVTGRQPVLQPGESFEYTSTAPLSVRPLGTTPVVARMQGEYSFVRMGDQFKGEAARQAKLGVFHFVLPALDTA